MELSLQSRETEVLVRALERHLGNLREEIVKTENYDWRQSMHEDEDIIKSILSRLSPAHAAS
jgi:hypothetical protein